MKKLFLLLISLQLLGYYAESQQKGKLVWSDEFNYQGLPDPGRWGYEEGLVRNNEAQLYTRADADNARVQRGMLVIEARKEQTNRADYTSASLTTEKNYQFTYGRIEVRAKLPMGRGTWPAIWMLGANIRTAGWPACGEIDIMENVGFDSMRIHANIHTEAYNHVKKTNKGNVVTIDKPWEDFHIYAAEWSKDKIDFYVDNKPYFTYTKEKGATEKEWPFDKPHYLILNLAIGGAWGGQKKIDDTRFPQRFYIDYVRVYQN